MAWEDRMLKDRVSHHKWIPTGALDAYGAPVAGFQPELVAPVYSVPAFMSWVTARTRTGEGEEVVVKGWRCAVSASYLTPLNERDRIKWNGREFDIVGIADARRPGGLHHYELELVEVSSG